MAKAVVSRSNRKATVASKVVNCASVRDAGVRAVAGVEIGIAGVVEVEVDVWASLLGAS